MQIKDCCASHKYCLACCTSAVEQYITLVMLASPIKIIIIMIIIIKRMVIIIRMIIIFIMLTLLVKFS